MMSSLILVMMFVSESDDFAFGDVSGRLLARAFARGDDLLIA